MTTEILELAAEDIQPGDRFIGARVAWVLAGSKTVTVRFDDGSAAYYGRGASVTVMRDGDL